MTDDRSLGRSFIGRAGRFLRQGKRIAIGVLGGVIVIVGIVLMPLPGPGMLIVLAGLAILATQFVWAQVLRDRARQRARNVLERLRGGSDGEPDEDAERDSGTDVDRRVVHDRSDVA